MADASLWELSDLIDASGIDCHVEVNIFPVDREDGERLAQALSSLCVSVNRRPVETGSGRGFLVWDLQMTSWDSPGGRLTSGVVFGPDISPDESDDEETTG